MVETPGAGHALPRPHRPLSRLALLGFVLAVVVGLTLALAGLGSRWGWWPFRTGFTLLKWAAYGGIAAALLSLAGAVRARPGGPRRGLPLALIGLIAGLGAAAVPWTWQREARSVPPIHDISTDLESPPDFVAVLPLRADAPNPPEHGGEEIARQQREAYPEIQPLLLPLPPKTAYERALETARDRGWEIAAAEPDAGRIEATDRTFWFGFEDDVVIRIRPAEGGSRVDVRSVSRVGKSDVGTNARRVRAYLRALREGV